MTSVPVAGFGWTPGRAHLSKNSRSFEMTFDLTPKKASPHNNCWSHSPQPNNDPSLECSICTKTFHTATSLQRHSRTHTTEKPYKCDFCNKSFRRADVCREHMRIHTGVRPYTCDMCGLGFKQHNHYKTHLRTKHQNVNRSMMLNSGQHGTGSPQKTGNLGESLRTEFSKKGGEVPSQIGNSHDKDGYKLARCQK